MEPRNPNLHRSAIDLNYAAPLGLFLVGVGGYNDVAFTELKDASSAAVRPAALIPMALPYCR